MSRLVDLTHVVRDGTVTYPGLPAIRISDHLSRADSEKKYAPGTQFQIARIEMVANTATYIDAPSHRFEEGMDIAALPLSAVADLEGVLIDATETTGGVAQTLLSAHPTDRSVCRTPLRGTAIEASLFPEDLAGKAVLIRTDWSRYFGTPEYGSGHPHLSMDAIAHLVAARPALVGIDSLNVDATADGNRPAHTELLRAGILIVEHLTNLAALPPTGFRFFAAPARVAGVGSFPVRAFAVVA